MFPRALLAVAAIALTVLPICSAEGVFGHRIAKGQIKDSNINEASGIAISLWHPDVIYTHNDKGDTARFFALNIQSGELLATFDVTNAHNYDWEDMSYGPCIDDCAVSKCSAYVAPSRYCIYIADTGNQGGSGSDNEIYMIREPQIITDAQVAAVSVLKFSWHQLNTETLMMSPDGRLFVISKVQGGQGVMAELPSSAWSQGRVNLNMSQAARLHISTTHRDPLGGEISPDGKELMIVAHQGVYHLNVLGGDYLQAVLTTTPNKITTYTPVHGTAGIAWRPDSMGFYVLAEGHHPTIYFYPREYDNTVIG